MLLPFALVVYAFVVLVWLSLMVVSAPFWVILKLAEALSKPKPRPRVRPVAKASEEDGVKITITLGDSLRAKVDHPVAGDTGRIK